MTNWRSEETRARAESRERRDSAIHAMLLDGVECSEIGRQMGISEPRARQMADALDDRDKLIRRRANLMRQITGTDQSKAEWGYDRARVRWMALVGYSDAEMVAATGVVQRVANYERRRVLELHGELSETPHPHQTR